MPNKARCLEKKLPEVNLKNVLVTVMAENMEIIIPTPSVMANPFIMLEPNQNKIKQVIMLEILESLIEGQALANPSSIEVPSGLPFFNSSLVLSNIKTLASTAIPMERIKPAIPERVKVTGHASNMAKVTKP